MNRSFKSKETINQVIAKIVKEESKNEVGKKSNVVVLSSGTVVDSKIYIKPFSK